MTNLEHVSIWHAEWQAAPDTHWARHINWTTAEDIARRLDEANAPAPRSCNKAPAGWYCVLDHGHDGTCVTYMDD
jgi:hypothetical protein